MTCGNVHHNPASQTQELQTHRRRHAESLRPNGAAVTPYKVGLPGQVIKRCVLRKGEYFSRAFEIVVCYGFPLPSSAKEVTMNVESILRAKGNSVITAKPDIPVTVAAGMLDDAGIGAVVISADRIHVEGILSERDIVSAIAKRGAETLTMPVANLMTRDVVTCSPEDRVADLMSIMTSRRIRHLPVISEDKLVGIVSIGDVVKWRVEEIEHESEALRAYVTQ